MSSPKLDAAMREIKAVLARYDVAGLVVIHEPGRIQFVCKIDPGYSVAVVAGNRLLINDDLNRFHGDHHLRVRYLNDTANMFRMIGETAARLSADMVDASSNMDKEYGTTHFDNPDIDKKFPFN